MFIPIHYGVWLKTCFLNVYVQKSKVYMLKTIFKDFPVDKKKKKNNELYVYTNSQYRNTVMVL